MAHKELHFDLDEKYIFTSKAKQKIFTLIGVGLAVFALGIILLATGVGAETAHHALAEHSVDAHANTAVHLDQAGAEHHAGHHEYHWSQRIWATLWVNNVFFTGIAVIGLFFVAYNYVAWAGWSASLIRVPMALPSFLPVTFLLMALVFVFGHHTLFHWTHDGITDPSSANYDKIIAGKKGFLNIPFYIIRSLIYFGAWLLIYSIIRKLSLKQDFEKENGVKYHNRIIYFSAMFLVVFGVSSSTSAWDWVMSIDTHWFSTMFGWYHLASWHVSGLATITLITIFLKEQGYLKMVNINHLHDLGKFMFAFSIFWTYVWFSQFLLIYYANITEETTYFMDRLFRFDNVYTPFFIINILINFIFPVLFLMSRDAKRQLLFLKIAAFGILGGHWLDFFLMIHPGVLKQNGGFGFLELGSIMIYVGLFIYVVSYTLSKAPLVAKNHPMLEESIHHNI